MEASHSTITQALPNGPHKKKPITRLHLLPLEMEEGSYQKGNILSSVQQGTTVMNNINNSHKKSSGVLDPFQRLQKNSIELNTVIAKAMVGGLDHPHLLGLTGPGKDCLSLLQRQEFVVSGVNLS